MTELIQQRYEAIDRLTAAGHGAADIALELGVRKQTIYRAWRRQSSPRWEGLAYTCERCDRITRVDANLPQVECARCDGVAYPPLSDAEVRRRLVALVKRLEAEEERAA